MNFVSPPQSKVINVSAFVYVAVLIAIALPDLEPFISLVGAVCFSILGLFCPAVIELFTFWEEPQYWGPLRWRMVKDFVLILLSVLALVSGTYASVNQIITFYQK